MDNKGNTENINIEILRRYFNQECNDLEKERVETWFNDLKLEKTLKKTLRDQWEEIALKPPGSDIDSDRIFDKIYRHIHTNEWRKEQNKPFSRKLYNTFSKIAAILILPVLIYSGWSLKNSISASKTDRISYAEIYSPLGARTHFELPDGSSGWLNSGSTLKFPVKFHGSTRKVSLIGEAYFDIAKNTKKPFVVNAGNIEVMALGTRFNVLDYPDDKSMHITLEAGKVVINAISRTKKVIRITELEPDQQLIIQKGSMESQKRKVDSKNYTSWKHGMLIFRNDPMSEIIKRLQRWYNVEITMEDKEIETYRYRATFEDETLNEALTLLKLTSPIDFVQDKRVKLADGTFTKKKIEMFIKPEYKSQFKK